MGKNLGTMSDPTTRVLQLLNLMQTHRFWPGADLAERLGVSERTLRRDIERLRDLGYLVDATPGVAGGYRLAAGNHLPPLLLDDEEAIAIAVGLRAAAGASIEGIEEASVRAMAKLEQVTGALSRSQTPESDVGPFADRAIGGLQADEDEPMVGRYVHRAHHRHVHALARQQSAVVRGLIRDRDLSRLADQGARHKSSASSACDELNSSVLRTNARTAMVCGTRAAMSQASSEPSEMSTVRSA